MEIQDKSKYQFVVELIECISEDTKQYHVLNEIAVKLKLSLEEIDKMFVEWAGVIPEKFMQFINASHAKSRLKNEAATLFDSINEINLSSSNEAPNLFVKIEAMTAGELINHGINLEIGYGFSETPFGKVIVATTNKGICHLVFEEDENKAIVDLKSRFPKANYQLVLDDSFQNIWAIFHNEMDDLKEIKLHVKGTDFQLKVWNSLLKIPLGTLTTYGEIAKEIGNPKASRAVGTAIGSNPIAFIIPCHRVIQSSGNFGGYMWGTTRKTAMIGWEGAKSLLEI